VNAAEAVAKIKALGNDPLAALLYAMVVVRGGQCRVEDAFADTEDWIRKNGGELPTWEQVEAWAALM
jgi:hypothetical protein